MFSTVSRKNKYLTEKIQEKIQAKERITNATNEFQFGWKGAEVI